jgi:AcrR family transcriptional regulator
MTKAGKKVGVRTRKDPRREATRNKIIDCAEEMFADFGIEGVSMRQIRLAVGSANTNVVAYHFGTKEALVEAILHERLPQLEARRAQLLMVADQKGLGSDLYELNRVQCLPLLEMTNAKGRHSFAGFMESVGRADWSRMRIAIDSSFPVTKECERRIASLLPKNVLTHLDERTFAAIAIITTVLQRIDRTARADKKRSIKLFEDGLRMVVAATTAPTH